MSIYSFDSGVASECGINAAIIFHNIHFWWQKNQANGSNLHDGRFWVYNSVKAFGDLFPFLSAKQIRSALDKLVEHGYLLTGEYNKAGYDRTKWYTPLKTYNQTICPVGKNHLPSRANAFAPKGEPIPIIKPDSKPINNNKRRTRIPDDFALTDEMYNKAARYWADHGHSGDLYDCFDAFVDHHKSKGSVMASWVAAWGTWYRNAVKFAQKGAQGESGGFIARHNDNSWADNL